MSDTASWKIDLKNFKEKPRFLVEAILSVAPGTNGRFQPTGFPDQGPALYTGIRYGNSANGDRDAVDAASLLKPESVRMLIVQSAAAIANGLEEVCLSADRYNADCEGIPYVRVLDGHASPESFLTSSVREPHRLASPYVLSAKMSGSKDEYRADLKKALSVNKQRPVRTWELARKLFSVDPGCVLHGVFLEELDGRLRLPRLISGYIEAANPGTANYGGVYRGEVTAKDNIPFSRQEFTSDEIKASFTFHLATMESYGLSEDQERFLVLWGLYKIDRLLHSNLRLRTACDLELARKNGVIVKLGESGWSWPSTEDIKCDLIQAKARCFPLPQDLDEWKRRNVTVLTFTSKIPPSAVETQGLTQADFNLVTFEGRAQYQAVFNFGTKTKKDEKPALILSGDWDNSEFQSLLELNPEKSAEGEVNRAHGIVRDIITKHTANLEKLRKKEQGGD
jgi:CRISPR-associated protein Csb1